MSEKVAVILLSGGLDSATVLAIARQAGYRCHCLAVDYGQRHRVELEASERVARALGADEHRVARVDLSAFGGSALTDERLEVPKGRELEAISGGIPITYVPARNTVFLSIALGWAEVLGSSDLFVGVNAVDYSGYPDCRPEFVLAFEALANLATQRGVEGARLRVRAPLLRMSKAEIVERGSQLGVDYALTISCYSPDGAGLACGACDACILRRKGFVEAGLADPTRYV